MGIGELEEQIETFVYLQKEIHILKQYVYQQWEKDKNEQLSQFPTLAYIDTNKLEHTKEYQKLKSLSVKTLKNMTACERKQEIIQIQKVHQTMQTIVHAVMETMNKYPVSNGDKRNVNI
ncbi:hypothetical protein BK784_26485 [Bacillus thuringiensis serovar medellin]|uniref:Uncharacterized protein n=1 Tax=Bacillus thuringiensis subsp. medellin TaxID=79672 RepID=A0A9X6MUN9_BACTV|nr:hypothetical protein [Bacillus thuringiensis]OUB89774.1 hypothetical protein BK784_26485 [Bacillus thuringiensis serovar medellin]